MRLETSALKTGCSHRFTAGHGDGSHYCTYIKPHLIQTFPANIETPDDFVLYSFFASAILWFDLITCDLEAAFKVLDCGTDRATLARIVRKRLKRAITCLNVVNMASDVVNAHIVGQNETHLSRVIIGRANDISLFGSMESITAKLLELVLQNNQRAATQDYSDVISLVITVKRKLTSVREGLEELLSSPEAAGATARTVRVMEFIDVDAIVRPARDSLIQYHAQAQQENTTHDELTFIKAHQAFELWFPTVLTHINWIVDHLTALLPSRNARMVERFTNRVADVLRLFEEMIRIPQTMTAMDYLAFRQQLRAGSGAESVGFRLIELALGQRDSSLMDYLSGMNLVTDEIEYQLSRPSLYDAFLSYLSARGLVSTERNDVSDALASIMRPTAEPNLHADIMWLAEAFLDVEQSFDRWRIAHLSMVDRMIGYRKSLGVGAPAPANGHAAQSPHGPDSGAARDARPYLVRTLEYSRMFPAVWEARHLLREHA